MPIDPSIPLSFRPPPPIDLLQNIGQYMHLRDFSAQIKQRQAEARATDQRTEELRVATAENNRKLQGRNALQDLYRQADNAASFGKGDWTAAQGVVPPDILADAEKARQDIIDKKATARKTDIENEITGNAQIAKTLQAMVDPSFDESQIASSFPEVTQRLQAQGFLDHVDPNVVHKALTSPPRTKKEVQDLINHSGFTSGVNEAALIRQKEQQGIATSAATAQKDIAQGNEAQASADFKNLQLQFMKAANPQQLDALVDNRLPVAQFPEQNRAAKAAGKLVLGATGDPKLAAEAVEKVAMEADAITKEKALIPGQIEKAVAVERATAPIQEARAVRVATANRGQADAIKIDEDYRKAKTASEALGRFLDLTDRGNKAAGSALPVMNAEAQNAVFGIKRINKFDIDQAGGLEAGNIFDRIMGKVGKLAVGQPIPQDVRDDIRALHEELATNAYQSYTGGLDSLSKRTGIQFKPTQDAPNIRRSESAANAPPLPSTLSQSDVGKVYTSPKTGRRLKITAVNPANPKQFRSEDQ